MEREDFEKAFKEIKNKNIGKKYYKKNLAKANKDQAVSEIINAIKSMDKGYSSEGVYKKCMFFGDNDQYAMLKYKDKVYKPCKKQYVKNDEIIKFNEWLISNGIKTPKMYTIFFADSKYFEINERIKGQALFLNDVNVVSHALGKMPYDTMVSILTAPMSHNDKRRMGDNLYRHNMLSQSMLLKFDQSKFDDLFRQYIFLRNIGFRNFDIHPGNIMINKNGFNIIDLNIDDELEDIKDELQTRDNRQYDVDQVIKILSKHRLIPNNAPNYDLAYNFVNTFCASLDYQEVLNKRQKLNIQNNNAKIVEKAIKAITKYGFKLSDDSIVLTAVGDNKNIYNRLMACQREL